MRGRLGAFTLAALVFALVFMLLFEATVTRIVGVVAMIAFIVAGVFLIASPGFLDAEE
jgi:preprotein translocase subunit SecD